MIQIFTDLAANLPPRVVEENHIGILPLTYRVDGVEIDPAAPFDAIEFYDAMRKGADVKTSMPSPGDIRDTFVPVLERGDDIVCLCLSSGISGTYALLRMVAKELEEENPGRKVRVLDTRGASLGEGQHAVEAAQLAAGGVEFEELCAHLEKQIDRMNQYFVVDQLKYLRKTGRLWGGAALAGQLLQIKPILFGDHEGHIVMRDKVRGKKRAVERLAELYAEKRTDPNEPVGIAQADCPGDALHLVHLLREAGQTGPINVVGYEPITGSHVGPGTLALFFFANERSKVL
ncbi:MAG: DegV family protein [Oscillospiraceae bacterium]|nr:DegV family protein [Oscillospiraceae bacterium]